jgi:hypothetical protein
VIGLVLGIVAIVAFALWLLRGSEDARRPSVPGRDSGIDHAELEAAEREVRDFDVNAIPGEEQPGDDWGPGTVSHRPRPPEHL